MTMMKERTYGYNRKTGEARIFEEGEIMGAEWATTPPPGVHPHDKEAGVKFEPEDDEPKNETDNNPPRAKQTGFKS